MHTAGAGTAVSNGTTTVAYIDSAAAMSGRGIGKAIWDAIQRMRFICVTCHSILLQKTVDFWQACGMRRMDPSSEKDCEDFRRAMLVHTTGKVLVELADVVRELPTS